MLKKQVFRSPTYRRYVASLPCCVTGYQGEGVDPHHIKGHGFGGTVKCSDLFCIPLKHELHVELHDKGWQSFEEKYNVSQYVQALYTIEQAEEDGVLSFESRNFKTYQC